ncbi:MAG: hypothetical protein EB084_17950 [Proteobacteria bacterium]|nr:hypothetical protein [Pseudomonadota bacterium]
MQLPEVAADILPRVARLVPHGVVVDPHRAPPFAQLRTNVPHGVVVDLGLSPTVSWWTDR